MAVQVQTLVNALFGPSGANHSQGLVPDPGGVAGASRFLREDATWQPASGIASAPLQRLVTASPVVVGSTDQIINVNISTGSPTCTLPLASTRAGVAVTFKDVGGNFGSNSLTITPAGADTIDGLASIVLGTPWQGITLLPANDGTSTGWFIL